MLYGTKPEEFESEKERNLYYKFFAGYFFNELVEGVEDRLRLFSELLRNPTAHFGASLPERLENFVLERDSTHVSFDNYAYLIQGVGEDKGEFADVVIHDRAQQILVAIEAKVYDNWSFDKDIASNAARLGRLQAALPGTAVIACLLLPSRQWPTAPGAARRTISYDRLLQASNVDLTVLLWEDLLERCTDPRVANFLRRRITIPKSLASYYIAHNGFRAVFAEYEAELERRQALR